MLWMEIEGHLKKLRREQKIDMRGGLEHRTRLYENHTTLCCFRPYYQSLDIVDLWQTLRIFDY